MVQLGAGDFARATAELRAAFELRTASLRRCLGAANNTISEPIWPKGIAANPILLFRQVAGSAPRLSGHAFIVPPPSVDWREPGRRANRLGKRGMALFACRRAKEPSGCRGPSAVSYTHLDVYKRQLLGYSRGKESGGEERGRSFGYQQQVRWLYAQVDGDPQKTRALANYLKIPTAYTSEEALGRLY